MRPLMPLAFATAIVAAAPAQAALDDVAAHLRALDTMRADFTQTAANGAATKGRMILARPGRIRFEYDNSPLLVVADGRALNMIDYKVAQVSRWPIRNTPLAVLLDPNVNLAKYARELSPAEGGMPGMVTVEAKDPKHREYGTITLYFGKGSGPAGLTLRGWKVLDAQGNVTQVQLSNVRFGTPVQKSAFTFRDPRVRMQPGAKG